MKLGLIKKSIICVLSLSFCTVLASCAVVNKSDAKSKSIFNNADIQAYAKKNTYIKESKTIEAFEVSTADYTLESNGSNLSILQNKETGAYRIYSRYASVIFDVATEGTEEVTSASLTGVVERGFGNI